MCSVGLELMSLLAQNRLAEFHASVEQIERQLLSGPAELEGNPYLAYPVQLERFLVEGSYKHVFLIEHNAPAESYAFFAQILLKTVRYALLHGLLIPACSNVLIVLKTACNLQDR